MTRFRNYPIRHKLILLTMLTCGISLLLASVSFIAYEFVVAREEITDRLVTLADIVGTNSAAALVFDDPAAAEETLRSLKAVDDLTTAVIYAEDSSRFATAHFQDDGTPFLPETLPEADYRITDGHVDLFRPILLDDQRIGIVYLRADLQIVYARLYQYAGIVVIVTFVSSLVAFLLSSRLQRTMVAEPISMLVQATKDLAQGNYSARAALHNKDEIGMLAWYFNEMADTIEEVQSELINAKEEAESMNRLKSAVLDNISHEIRTPLTGILGYIDLLGENSSKKDEREFIHHIREGGRRLMKTFSSVLDLSIIESGKMQLNKRLCDLENLIIQSVDLLQPLASEKNLELRVKILTENRSIIIDENRLSMILDNLIGNAIKFTEQGEIIVQLQDSSQIENSVEIVIRDTGIGIDEDFFAHLFNPFRQESSGNSRSHNGVGLGLSITKNLVELMGGQISAESKKGVGSAFTVSFRKPTDQNRRSMLRPPKQHALPIYSRSSAASTQSARRLHA